VQRVRFCGCNRCFGCCAAAWSKSANRLCDEAVVDGGCSPRRYADFLLNMAERLAAKPREQIVGVGIISFRSALGSVCSASSATHSATPIVTRGP
jgi:hypothetical protein